MYRNPAFKKYPNIYIRHYEFEVQYSTEVVHVPAHAHPQLMGNRFS